MEADRPVELHSPLDNHSELLGSEPNAFPFSRRPTLSHATDALLVPYRRLVQEAVPSVIGHQRIPAAKLQQSEERGLVPLTKR